MHHPENQFFQIWKAIWQAASPLGSLELVELASWPWHHGTLLAIMEDDMLLKLRLS